MESFELFELVIHKLDDGQLNVTSSYVPEGGLENKNLNDFKCVGEAVAVSSGHCCNLDWI